MKTICHIPVSSSPLLSPCDPVLALQATPWPRPNPHSEETLPECAQVEIASYRVQRHGATVGEAEVMFVGSCNPFDLMAFRQIARPARVTLRYRKPVKCLE
jgi:hypothetical protein